MSHTYNVDTLKLFYHFTCNLLKNIFDLYILLDCTLLIFILKVLDLVFF